MKKIAILCLSLLLLCALAVQASAASETVSFTLLENPSTGYEWTVETSVDGVIELVGDEITADTKLDGAGGEHTWTYRGLASGTAAVTFTYARSWEDEDPYATISYICEVDEHNGIACVGMVGDAKELDPNA